MTKYKLDDNLAVSTLNGTRYKSIGGVITVNNESHAKELEKRFKLKPVKDTKEVNEDG